MASVTLAFMTNYTLEIPSITKQEKTIESFYNILKPGGILKTYIFCDQKPLSEVHGPVTLISGTYEDCIVPGMEYEKRLKSIPFFKDAQVVRTQSLCDGYKKALHMCETRYLFFLEHDWIFNDNIVHTIAQLVDIMNNDPDVNCILFNKYSNIENTSQKFYNTDKAGLLLTNRQSNNPNLLRVSHARDIRDPLISVTGCSCHPGVEFYYLVNNMKLPNYCGGIECELCNYCDSLVKIKQLGTYIYGSYGDACTVIHSDGCNRSVLEKCHKVH